VIFTNMQAERILHMEDSTLSCHNYIEFSENMLSVYDYIIVHENTLINVTNNEYTAIVLTDILTFSQKLFNF